MSIKVSPVLPSDFIYHINMALDSVIGKNIMLWCFSNFGVDYGEGSIGGDWTFYTDKGRIIFSFKNPSDALWFSIRYY